MDELVHTIENAAAQVDGTDIVEKADPAKSENGVTVEESPKDAPAAVATVVGDAPEETTTTTMPANELTKEEQTSTDAAAVDTPVAEVIAAPPSVTAAETPANVDAKPVETETQPKEESPVPTIVDEAPPAAVEVAPEVVPAPVVVEKEKSPEVVVPETDATPVTDLTTAETVQVPVPAEPVEPTPTIELDTTVETTVDGAEKEVTTEKAIVVEDDKKDESVVVLDDESENEVTESNVEPVVEEKKEPEPPTAMEVTIDEPEAVADQTLETPNVSICPMDKPQLLLANNRISELVLSNGSSTPNTSNPTSVEFQATPIKKTSIEEKLMEMEQEDETKSTDASLSCQDISSKSSSDAGMKRLQETLKQVNGTTTPESSSAAEISQLDDKNQSIDLVGVTAPESLLFDTVVNFQNGILQTLIVDRVVQRSVGAAPTNHAESSDASSEKSASNGSTTSLGPFALPGALTHTVSGLSMSSVSSAGVAGDKSRIQGVSGLRIFLQDLIKKLPDEEKKKPAGRGKGRTSQTAATVTTPAKSAAPTTPTRTTAANTTPKSTEATTSAKKQVAFAATTNESQVGNFVMARWSDKKYYAGRVSAEKPGNKFQIRFEDGAQRTLPRDQIVFGDKSVCAQLKDQECNVLVDENIYETGLVLSIDPEACTYTVMTNSGQFTKPASALYLEEDQAKQVQGSGYGTSISPGGGEPTVAATGRRKRTSDVTKSSPEAGPSNAGEPATKKSRKR